MGDHAVKIVWIVRHSHRTRKIDAGGTANVSSPWRKSKKHTPVMSPELCPEGRGAPGLTAGHLWSALGWNLAPGPFASRRVL